MGLVSGIKTKKNELDIGNLSKELDSTTMECKMLEEKLAQSKNNIIVVEENLHARLKELESLLEKKEKE